MFSSYTPPEARIIKSAKIQIFNPPIVAPPPVGFQGGVVLGDSTPELRLRHSRYHAPIDRFSSTIKDYHYIEGEYCYAGPLYDHFGHTMSEFVHRLIPSILIYGKKKFIFVSDSNRKNISGAAFPNYLRAVLGLMGISGGDILVIDQDTVVNSILICEQGSDFGGGPKTGYLNYIDLYFQPILNKISRDSDRISRVYVSRSNISGGGRMLGEKYFQEILRNDGFYVMHPENIPFNEQMIIYMNAEILVFSEGSACHGIELMGAESLNRCYMIERRKGHRDIFYRIFKNRAKSFRCLTGGIEIPSFIMQKGSDALMEHLGCIFYPPRDLINYFASENIVKLSNFSQHLYFDSILQDFEEMVAHYYDSKTVYIDREKLEECRQLLSYLIEVII